MVCIRIPSTGLWIHHKVSLDQPSWTAPKMSSPGQKDNQIGDSRISGNHTSPIRMTSAIFSASLRLEVWTLMREALWYRRFPLRWGVRTVNPSRSSLMCVPVGKNDLRGSPAGRGMRLESRSKPRPVSGFERSHAVRWYSRSFQVWWWRATTDFCRAWGGAPPRMAAYAVNSVY